MWMLLLRCACAVYFVLHYVMALQQWPTGFKSSGKSSINSTSRSTSDSCIDRSPEQLAAVHAPLGATCVVAGPGTGKTRVLTQRIQHLIDNKVDPQAILAVTFTRQAAAEMKLRLQPLLSSSSDGAPLIGTFHAACLLMLREFSNELSAIAPGLNSKFGVSDVKASDKLLKAIMKSEDLQRALVQESSSNKTVELISDSDATRAINRIKCDGLDYEEYYDYVQD
jgi:superfamily I DNA/RNA helicase